MNSTSLSRPHRLALFVLNIYISPGGRFYEVLSIIVMSAGINVLTTTGNWFTNRSGLEALLLTFAGVCLYFVAGKIMQFKQRAREQQQLDKRGTEKEALEKVLTADIRYSLIGTLRSVLLLLIALLLVLLAIYRIAGKGGEADGREAVSFTHAEPALGEESK